MKKTVLLLALLIFSLGTFAQEKENFMVIGPAEYQEQLLQPKVQLIDVRTPAEFSEGHIARAQNIDFQSKDFLEQFDHLDKDRPLYIYCRSGNRSAKAAKKLLEMGFEQIIDLKGGYLSWEEFIKD